MLTGMPDTTTATSSAVTKPNKAAQWAFISKMPMAPSSTMTGMAPPGPR